jgi:X-X-X-Leu-X-X-Gly heptad repeat protein
MAPRVIKERTGAPKQKVQPANHDEQLSEESERLATALELLAMGQLAQDTEPVNNGSEHVTNGSRQLINGSERVTNGSEQVANGSEHVTNGSKQVASGTKQVANGSDQIPNGGEPATNGSGQITDWSEPIAKVTGQVTRGSNPPVKESEQLTTEFFQSISEALAPRRTLPGFADPRVEHINSIELPPWFIDRCRRAYLSVPFDAEAECRVLGVTSAYGGEGKTSVAIGIATAMAVDSKKPTLLLECDFADPSFYKFFGINVAGGLSEWLDGGSRLRIVRGAAYAPNVFVIPSGTAQTEPARYFYELLDRNVLEGLRGCFGNLVIDLPPTLNISYAPLAYALADRLLIVARSRVTLTNDLERLVNLIGKDRVSGIVLNGTDDRTPRWLRPLL